MVKTLGTTTGGMVQGRSWLSKARTQVGTPIGLLLKDYMIFKAHTSLLQLE